MLFLKLDSSILSPQRFHQGVGNSLIKPAAANDNTTNGEIPRRSILGGLLYFYYREAG